MTIKRFLQQKYVEDLRAENAELRQYIKDNNVDVLVANIEETIRTREELEQTISEVNEIKGQYRKLLNDLLKDKYELQRQMLEVKKQI
ncbi:hypothetical protein [Coprococcus sp. RTP21281st1_F1_RTP21281_210402]|jgi:uncharacterized protein YaaQ|uniref:hypothetical protein n=1 Tax=Coprococcus sp. RTP21281st1_F1_RTP21281_210402 TaxID=3143208 RepID=UPI0034A43832